MGGLLDNVVGHELFFVYGLVALVIILIIVIIVIDKKESKKKPKNLFDTLNMKIIADSNKIENEDNIEINFNKDDNEEKQEELITPLPEVIEMKQKAQEVNFQDLEPIPEVKVVTDHEQEEPILEQQEEVYIETDLEKTQAQIRVEEITAALKKAQVEEQIQEDKYAKFEEEQEKNAIISYNELKESFDKLYSENEKTQYLEDDEIPINIDELYQLSNSEEKKKSEPKTVQLEDLSDFSISKPEDASSKSTFKSSPLISPVYGIQKPPVTTKSTVDTDIQNANQFLQSLKELKNNLD